MEYQLKLFQQNRKNIIKILKEHSLEQANTVLEGLNNNLIWNAGHLLLAQQFLMYHFSNVPVLVPMAEMMPKYAGDTIPDGKATQEDLDSVLQLLESTSTKAVEDYNRGIFKSYTPYTSEYFGITINSIEEAISFNTFHEGVHFGHMAAIRVALKNS